MTHQQSPHIRVRFAPSPTGHLHIGGLRTALFNWLFARHTGGTYLLRVEDTDVQRSTNEYLQSQLKSLAWAGLKSDEPLVYQSDRFPVYQAKARELVEQGNAYPCFCTPRDADELIQNLEQGAASQYDGTCRNLPLTSRDYTKPHAIRIALPEQATIEFNDLIHGNVQFATNQFDDYVIMRRDGSPTYNFCVVIDDLYMKISHIIRGDEHLSNTPKQLFLYQAFGKTPPIFAHIPLILGKAGNKLSKRDAATSVEQYRNDGFIADALINYLVRLGWSHGDQEIFTKEELCNYFSLDQVGKKGSIFDIEKLRWVNGVYLRTMAPQDLFHQLAEMNDQAMPNLLKVWSQEQLELLLEHYRQRVTSLHDLYESLLTFAQRPQTLDINLIAKWQTEKTKPMLEAFSKAMSSLNCFDHAELLACAQHIIQEHNEKLITIAQPLRLALTGQVQSPSVFDLMGILGKEKTLSRIKYLIDAL